MDRAKRHRQPTAAAKDQEEAKNVKAQKKAQRREREEKETKEREEREAVMRKEDEAEAARVAAVEEAEKAAQARAVAEEALKTAKKHRVAAQKEEADREREAQRKRTEAAALQRQTQSTAKEVAWHPAASGFLASLLADDAPQLTNLSQQLDFAFANGLLHGIEWSYESDAAAGHLSTGYGVELDGIATSVGMGELELGRVINSYKVAAPTNKALGMH
jgi:hypothetical protein